MPKRRKVFWIQNYVPNCEHDKVRNPNLKKSSQISRVGEDQSIRTSCHGEQAQRNGRDGKLLDWKSHDEKLIEQAICKKPIFKEERDEVL